MKNTLLNFLSRLRGHTADNAPAVEEPELENEAWPALSKQDQERIERGRRITMLAEQLVNRGDTYDFLFKHHTMEDIFAPAAIKERQRILNELIKHARAYAACPQKPPTRDIADFEPEI